MMMKPFEQPVWPPVWAVDMPCCPNTNHFKLLPNGSMEFTSDPRGHTIEECKLHCGGRSKSYPLKKDLAWRKAYTAIQATLRQKFLAVGFSLGTAGIIAGLLAPRIPIPPNAKDYTSQAEFDAAWNIYARQFAMWEGHNTSLTKNDLEALIAEDSEMFEHVLYLLRGKGVMWTKDFLIHTFGSAREGRSNVEKNIAVAETIAAVVANDKYVVGAAEIVRVFDQIVTATQWCLTMGMAF
jgi:hypothetical protein